MRWTPHQPRARRPATATSTPIRGVEAGGIELRHVLRYSFVAGLVGASMLLSAWSRIDLVETAVALDETNADLKTALAERDRLELELATLVDPRRLDAAAAQLELATKVEVRSVPRRDGLLPKATDAAVATAEPRVQRGVRGQPPDGGSETQ